MTQGESKRHAVIVPGGMFGPSAPLPAYAGYAAERRDAEIHRIWWDYPLDTPGDEREPWVRAHVAPVLDNVPGTPLLVGRSLGTLSAPLAAERGLPAVWLNPLLTEKPCVDALRRATAPFLLIGGTADDECWDGTLARELSPHVLEIEGADHTMMLPGPLSESAVVLGQVVTAIERFLDEVVWPRST